MKGFLFLLLPILSLRAEVRIVRQGEAWTFMRDGTPYYAKGAVLYNDAQAISMMDMVKKAGGNSARTGAGMLDALQARGMTGFIGLPVGKARLGFDYSDVDQTAKLEASIREIVSRHKDHPALLLWSIGNEPNLGSTREQARQSYVWIEKAARLVKSIDPNHPVITVISDGELLNFLLDLNELCPSLDAVGLNAYHGIYFAREDVQEHGWTRPYLITEFGPRGHWQVAKTPWGMPIEDNSTEKAGQYRAAYESITTDTQCLGSYVFLWYGKHQEKTHTWYNMFLADGSRTGAVDQSEWSWTGKRPANLSPEIVAFQVHQVFWPPTVKTGSVIKAKVAARDADGDALQYEWDLRVDVADNPNDGGDREPPSFPIPGAVVAAKGAAAEIRMPEKPGPYRLFVYVRDGKGGGATANRPIRVE
jgi:hypothetical protein